MQISLQTESRRIIAIMTAVLLVSIYMILAVRAYVAFHYAQAANSQGYRTALKFAPGDAAYEDRLGLFSMFVDFDSNGAAYHCRRAVELNPHVARYWLDLAAAYQVLGNESAQGEAIHRAIKVDPTTPSVLWEAGNYYLVRNDVGEALNTFRVILEQDPDFNADQILELSWRATRDVELLLNRLVPRNPSLHIRLINVLMRDDQRAAARVVWRRIVSLQQPITAKSAMPYLDHLIEKQDLDVARSVWHDLPALSPDSGIQPVLAIANGGFERSPLGGGFEWRFRDIPHVKLDFDRTDFHEGARSLVVEFDGEPVPEAGISQYVLVEPGSTYEFSAYTKMDTLLSASGPRLRFTDAYTGVPVATTDDFLGSSSWRRTMLTVNTGSASRLLKLSIVRDPAFQRIQGKFWIDDLQMVKR